MSNDQLPLLEYDIDQTRARLDLHRQLLSEQLAFHGGGVDSVDELLTAMDEFGAEHVVSVLGNEPWRWNLTALPAARQATIGNLLHQLSTDSDDFDRLVAAREDILVAADTTHQRSYPWFGRTFRLDAAGRQLQFSDGSPAEPTSVAVVTNRSQPTVHPNLDPPMTHKRKRDRSM